MGNVVKIIDDINAKWKVKQKDLQETGLHIENRKLVILDRIKAQRGPFSSAEQIDNYLLTTDGKRFKKTTRMGNEVTYARDTSSSLPKNSPCLET